MTRPILRRRICSAAVLLGAALLAFGCDKGVPPAQSHGEGPGATGSYVDSALELRLTSPSVLEDAFANRRSGIQVLVKGTVTRFLSDDVTGSEHQRFIVKMADGQTLLAAHNIDIGRRVPISALNHLVYLYGEYAYNGEGGVVHWTHVDPGRAHVDGWIQFDGTRYQ